MKAKAYFHALGQSHETRDVSFRAGWLMTGWPWWAKRAYCAGRCTVPLGSRGRAQRSFIEDFRDGRMVLPDGTTIPRKEFPGLYALTKGVAPLQGADGTFTVPDFSGRYIGEDQSAAFWLATAKPAESEKTAHPEAQPHED